MSFKVNSPTARIVKAKRVSRLESIVTLVILIIALGAFTYPVYFTGPSVYLYAIAGMKLIMASVVIFDAVGLFKSYLKTA